MARKREPSELVYLPLGGAGEIGMNLYLYGFGPPQARKWIAVDVGIGFADETMPGIEIVMPDVAFLEAERENLLAIVLTHAHEDHFGAVAALWPRLRAPIYATAFAAAMLRLRLEESGLEEVVPVNLVEPGAHIELGPFDVEYVTVTHSIPEPHALIIRTEAATVLHTGDWKIDDRPVIGAPTDEARLRALGDAGCDVMVCDSTNVFREGSSVSESDVAHHLEEIIGQATGRVAVTTFSSNVARVLSLARAAHKAGREVVVVGRALHRIISVARETGYLDGAGQFLDQDEFADLPPERVLAMLTGSQGEYRAALARVAHGVHPSVSLEPGDTMIFSSKTIPGNEKSVGDIENRLAARGVEVIDADRHVVHVTGHPRREELKQMYAWVRPRVAIPMHGEMRHLAEHVRLARDCGVETALVVPNGSIARLGPGEVHIVDEAPSGRLLRDGDVLTQSDAAMRERRRLAASGAVFVALVIDASGDLVFDPDFEIIGVPEATKDGSDMGELVEKSIDAAVEKLPRARRRDPDHLGEMVRRAVRTAIERAWGKRTDCRVSVTQV